MPGRAHDGFDAVRAFIEGQLRESGIASLAVAVARDGDILWEEGFGWADREERLPATEHTLYSLASISKPITATGMMVLRERGLLDLERPIDDYLGDARVRARAGSAEGATVRRMAAHCAGLPLHYQFFYADEPRRRPPMAETIRRYANLMTPPGEEYWYSNLGYGLIDHVVARLSGRSYPDFMREDVFIPLNMTHASVGVAPGLERQRAERYGPDGLPLPMYDFDHPGGSAVYCSAHDLVRFGMFHLKAHLPDQRALLPDAAIDEMQRPVVEHGDARAYALGWAINEDANGYRTVEHGGGMGGVSTFLQLIPSRRLAVAVLTNGQTRIHMDVVAEVLSLLLPDYGEERERRRAEAKEGDERPEWRTPPELRGAWQGQVHTYDGEVPLTLTFQEDGDVHARLGEQLATLVSDPCLEAGTLTGRMMGEIGTEDTAGHDLLLLRLKLRPDSLEGAVTATAPPHRGSGRMRNALSHWTRLERP